MTGLPRVGEHVTVLWPGGPVDFVLKFEYATPSDRLGWIMLTGILVEPCDPQHLGYRRTFYVRPEGDGYTLLPRIKD